MAASVDVVRAIWPCLDLHWFFFIWICTLQDKITAPTIVRHFSTHCSHDSNHYLPDSYRIRALGRFLVNFSSCFTKDFAFGLKSLSSSSIIMAALLCGIDKETLIDLHKFFFLLHFVHFKYLVLLLINFRRKISLDVVHMEASCDQCSCSFIWYRRPDSLHIFPMPCLANF